MHASGVEVVGMVASFVSRLYLISQMIFIDNVSIPAEVVVVVIEVDSLKTGKLDVLDADGGVIASWQGGVGGGEEGGDIVDFKFGDEGERACFAGDNDDVINF